MKTTAKSPVRSALHSAFNLLCYTLIASVFPLSIAVAGEFQENAMCATANPSASFQKISLQTDPTNSKRGILILYASDGWTQVYSGPIKQTANGISFREDGKVIAAAFDKTAYSASISFNNDVYVCDERSFGN